MRSQRGAGAEGQRPEARDPPRGPTPYFEGRLEPAPEQPLELEPEPGQPLVLPHVVVVGAGLAGLTAAEALLGAGCSVTVLEAGDTPGGRCRTTAEGAFDGGQLVELGPEFVHSLHDYVLRAAATCGVDTTREAETDNEEAGFPLSQREQEIVAALAQLALKIAPECVSGQPPHPDAAELSARLDAVSMTEFLRSEFGADEGNLEALGRDFASLAGATMDDISALHALLEEALFAHDDSGDFRLIGGTSLLAQRMADRVAAAGGELEYGEKVATMHQPSLDSSSVIVTTASGKVLHAAAAVVTAPTFALQSVAFEPALPPAQADAIAELRYGDLVKTPLQFKTRWWDPQGDGSALPEHPGGKALHDCAGAVYDPTGGVPTQEGRQPALLMAYFAPPTTQEITALPTAESRLRRVLQHVATIAPDGVDVEAEYEKGAVQCWREDESAGGVCEPLHTLLSAGCLVASS
jgi:monoamine oxidase